MDIISEKFNAKKVAIGSATLFNGLVAGALCFVSNVDVATIKKMQLGPPDNLKAFTCAWWPCGRDYMQPLIGATVILNFAAAFTTNDIFYIGTSGLIMSVGLWTGVMMNENINGIIDLGADSTSKSFKKHYDDFCFYHHFRAVFALTAASLVIWKTLQ